MIRAVTDRAIANDKMKKKKHIIFILVLLLAVLIVITACSFEIYNMKITQIDITETKYYSEEELQNIIFDTQEHKRSIIVFIETLLGKKKTIPFIQDYEVKFNGFHSVEVNVLEKPIAGCFVYMGNYIYFDSDGIVVETSIDKRGDLPLIEGLRFNQVVMNEKIPVDNEVIFRYILNITQLIQSYDDFLVDRIYFDSNSYAILYIKNIKIIMGSNEYLEGKIAQVYSMMPSIEELSGKIDLSDYSESATNKIYILEPDK